MAQPKLKISALSTANTIKANDNIMILQDGVNKISTISNLLKNLNTNDNIRFNSEQLPVNISFATKNNAKTLHISGATDKIGIGTSTPAAKLHVVGNIQIGSDVTDGIFIQSTETIIYTLSDNTNGTIRAISPLRMVSILKNNTGTDGKYSLSRGSNGQIKTIVVNKLDIGKNVTITLNGEGFNTITLNAVGTSAVLQFFTETNKWYLIGGLNPVLSTV